MLKGEEGRKALELLQDTIIQHAKQKAEECFPDEPVLFNTMTGLVQAVAIVAADNGIPRAHVFQCLMMSLEYAENRGKSKRRTT